MSDYPYLCWSILLFMVFFFIYIVIKRFRLIMVLSGIASALYSLAAVFFVPDYWQPVLVIKSTVGLEDLLFSFANGGIVFIMALWPVRDRIKFQYTLGSLVKKYLFWTFFGGVLCFLFQEAGIFVMSCCLYAMVVVGMVLLLRNNRLWPLCLCGSIGFTVLYIGVTAIVGDWFPRFYTQWTLQNMWGYRFLGFPLEEYFWAFGYGAVFPMIMAIAFGISLEKRD